MSLKPELIPAILIAFSMGYTAVMWHLCRISRVLIPPPMYVIFIIVFGLQCLLYAVFHFTDVPIAVRGFWVRVSLIDMALSFSVPLTILYRRSKA